MNTYKIAILLTVESPNTAQEVEQLVKDTLPPPQDGVFMPPHFDYPDINANLTQLLISTWDQSSQQS